MFWSLDLLRSLTHNRGGARQYTGTYSVHKTSTIRHFTTKNKSFLTNEKLSDSNGRGVFFYLAFLSAYNTHNVYSTFPSAAPV